MSLVCRRKLSGREIRRVTLVTAAAVTFLLSLFAIEIFSVSSFCCHPCDACSRCEFHSSFCYTVRCT